MPLTYKRNHYPPVWFVRIIEGFRFSLKRLILRLYPSNIAILEMAQGFYLSRAAGVAAELNLAEHIGTGMLTVSELSVKTGTHEHALYRMMRMLACHGVFREKQGRVFANNRLSESLFDMEGSMRYMVMHQVTGINWKLFEELGWVVRTGGNAAEKVLGTDVFTWLSRNPDRNLIYNEAMSQTSALLADGLLSAYRFKGVRKLFDIGGGHGVLLACILQEYPDMLGQVFDLPHVVDDAAIIARLYGVEDRMEIMAGNFYENVPEGADTYMMKNVVHILSDDQAVALLMKVKNVLPPDGRILIIEPIIGKPRYSSFATHYDLQMLLGRFEGRERTRDEYKEMIRASGMKLKHFHPTISPFYVLEVVR